MENHGTIIVDILCGKARSFHFSDHTKYCFSYRGDIQCSKSALVIHCPFKFGFFHRLCWFVAVFISALMYTDVS